MTAHPQVAERPGYILSKMTGALLFQLIALNVPAEKMQIVTYNPGLVYGDAWKQLGFPPDRFDRGKIQHSLTFQIQTMKCNSRITLTIVTFPRVDELCGGFAVWAASKEAEFLHGRFTWAAWDVEELATGEVRKRIDSDPEFLRASIVGANGGI